MKIKPLAFAALGALLLQPLTGAPSAADTKEVVDLETGGTTTGLFIEAPDNPKAVLAIFPGGAGIVEVNSFGTVGFGAQNFAVRTRDNFRELGFATVLVDVPRAFKKNADNTGSGGVPWPRLLKKNAQFYRQSLEYLTMMRVVMRHLREKFGVPVWLHGHSRGPVGVTAIAAGLAGTPDAPDGIVLSASVFVKAKGKRLSVHDMNPGRITAPVLIVHHRDDACHATPASGVDAFARALSASSEVTRLLYSGGRPVGGKCKPNHYHGFKGIEKKVVKDVAEHILARVK